MINHQRIEQAKTRRELYEAFVDECQKVIDRVDRGEIPLQEGAYAITGLMFHKNISEIPELDDICTQAADLELPPEHITGNIPEMWNELKQAIKQLKT